MGDINYADRRCKRTPLLKNIMRQFNLHNFPNSWLIQKRVIGALLLREMLTRYGRHNIGFLWLFLEPMLFTLGVTALWTATNMAHGSNLPIVAFAVTGYSTVLLWRNMPQRCIGAVGPNLTLMFHKNVRVIDILLSRVILEFLGATLSFVVLSAAFIASGLMSLPEDLLTVIAGWLYTAAFGGSMALLLGSVSERSELIEKIWHPISYILFPLSGAAFIVDALPENFRQFVLLLPMVHGIELVRHGYFGSIFNAHYDVTYMLTALGLILMLALIQCKNVSNKVVPE
jgi:ABC-type polysaccharide/polyol phosphate export permease